MAIGVARAEQGGHADRERKRSELREGGLLHDHRRVILPHRFLEPVREALSLEGLGVALAILRPTLAVCTTRATQWLAAPLDVPGVIEELRNGFADLGDLERCVIDSGELDAAMTTDVLFARFENGVLSLP